VFRDLNIASKQLKDIRTAELRRLKEELPEKTTDELIEMLMDEN